MEKFGSGIIRDKPGSATLVGIRTIVADPDPGSGVFYAPGSGMEKNPVPGSGTNILNHIY
jgi:hypothetical protein